MAAYIPVPRDLTRVKSKILFNLTKRQLLCFGAGALIGVPSFFFLKAGGNTKAAPSGVDPDLLAKILSNPEMAALLTSLAKSLN